MQDADQLAGLEDEKKKSDGTDEVEKPVVVVVPVVVVSEKVSDGFSLQNFSSLIVKKSKWHPSSYSMSKSRKVNRRNSFGRMSMVQYSLEK